MVWEGMEKEALTCIQAIRDRYDGRKRNPFNENEAGYHYARAMASWAMVPAYTGFVYSAVDKRLTLANVSGTHIWTSGYGWGTFSVTTGPGGKGKQVEVKVKSGSLSVGQLTLTGAGSTREKKPVQIKEGDSYVFRINL
jgi:hypothetical protein